MAGTEAEEELERIREENRENIDRNRDLNGVLDLGLRVAGASVILGARQFHYTR
jgi:hypothetical protein